MIDAGETLLSAYEERIIAVGIGNFVEFLRLVCCGEKLTTQTDRNDGIQRTSVNGES